MNKKKIVFLTGTRADFGKLKPLIQKIDKSKNFECYIFVTGMHTLSKYGSTYTEVKKLGFERIFIFMNQTNTTDSEIILSNTISGFSNFIKEIKPNMIVVHGDRIETLAGAITGSLNNILVSHIEGGELSGTIDEIIRHAVTKLSHIHFVANNKAKERLIQLGENQNHIFVIGSPDIDIMFSKNLPLIKNVKSHYKIPFNKYAIFIFHPVTTEINLLKHQIQKSVDALITSKKNYIVIYPNNDPGSDIILNEYKRLEKLNNFKIFPSIRFENFLTLLKNSCFLIGNSSAGIRECEIYGIPTINIGSRQQNRSESKNIVNIIPETNQIVKCIKTIDSLIIKKSHSFGDGKSSVRFYNLLINTKLWEIPIQKQFVDMK